MNHGQKTDLYVCCAIDSHEMLFDNFLQNRNQPWQHTKKIRIFKNAVDPFFFYHTLSILGMPTGCSRAHSHGPSALSLFPYPTPGNLPAMATAAQAAAVFLSFLSSSPSHHSAPSSVSLGATPVLPVSLRVAAAAGPRLSSPLRGRRISAVIAQLPTA